MGATVKNSRHRLEAFLAGRVPDLNFNHLIVYLQVKRAKLNANRHLVLLLEFIIHHSLHEARLSNSCVANDYQFEKMVMLG